MSEGETKNFQQYNRGEGRLGGAVVGGNRLIAKGGGGGKVITGGGFWTYCGTQIVPRPPLEGMKSKVNKPALKSGATGTL